MDSLGINLISISLDIVSNKHPLIIYKLACYNDFIDSLPERFCPNPFFVLENRLIEKHTVPTRLLISFPLLEHLERIALVRTKKYFFEKNIEKIFVLS
jgi:hypothetical protein